MFCVREASENRSDMNQKLKNRIRQWWCKGNLWVALLLIVFGGQLREVRAQSGQSSGAQTEAGILSNALSGSEKLTLAAAVDSALKRVRCDRYGHRRGLVQSIHSSHLILLLRSERVTVQGMIGRNVTANPLDEGIHPYQSIGRRF